MGRSPDHVPSLAAPAAGLDPRPEEAADGPRRDPAAIVRALAELRIADLLGYPSDSDEGRGP